MNFFCKSVVLTAVLVLAAAVPIWGVARDGSLVSENGGKADTIFSGIGVDCPGVLVVLDGGVSEDFIPLWSLPENAVDVRLGYELGYSYGIFPAEELDEIDDWVELYDRTDWEPSVYSVP